MTNITIAPKKLFRAAVAACLVLVGLHMLFYALYIFAGIDKVIFLRDLFSLELEASVPTWFAQTQLLVVALIAAMIALHYRSKKSPKNSRRWLIFSGLILVLSIDEGAGFHEQIINIINQNTSGSGLFGNPWTIYALIFIGLAGILLLKFYLSLPRYMQVLLFASAAGYVSGAFLLDMIGGAYAGRPALHPLFFVPLEEGLELVSISLLGYSIAVFAADQKAVSTISYKNQMVIKKETLAPGHDAAEPQLALR